MPPKRSGPNRTLDILSSIGDQDFLGAEVMQNLRDHGLRVERIAITLIRPDAAQPRRVLPEAIHNSFHSQEITPVQALKQYIEKVRIIARQKGRPFENLFDLLTSAEDAKEDVALTPPERDLRDLTNLAVTLRQDGQVNPLTIVDRTEGAMRRLFWLIMGWEPVLCWRRCIERPWVESRKPKWGRLPVFTA
jgi:hypothetical protein